MSKEYDLIVIGAGSGNFIVNRTWRDKKVAIIEGGSFGGTCLNFGCIPTKQYVYPATLAYKTTHLSRLGVEAEVTKVNWQAMRDRIFTRIDGYSQQSLTWRQEAKHIDVYSEYAHFVDTHKLVTQSGQELTGKQIVIATGSRNQLPEVPGIDAPQVHTSDTVMRIADLPKRVVVIGGGFIAAEFSHVFSSLGSQVVQVNRSKVLLRGNDEDIIERFTREAAQQWDLRLNHGLKEIRDNQDGTASVILTHEGQEIEEIADLILIATGRVPNSDTVQAAEVGFDLNPDKTIAVDQYQRVLSGGKPVEGIWALGDVSSNYKLKHVANAEMRTVRHNLLNPEDLVTTDMRFVPAAVFTHPQIASVGLTEAKAREKAQAEGFEISTKIQDIASVAYGMAMEDQVGFVKLIARKDTAELLGAHIIGEEASLLIQPLVQAMSFGQSARDLARGQFWIHPALTEVVENALLGLKFD